ncbi:MAG TPA: protein kinase, partial [Blastocatellia bacterium]
MDRRYMKLDLIKQGGFANIYNGRDFKTGKKVVIKELRDRTIDSIMRFSREERILREHVGNPHVIQILDSNLQDFPPYLVLEYATHGSVEQYIGKLEWQRGAYWLWQISYGLGQIHRQDGFHRDIKPPNILLFAGHSEIVKLS